MPVEARGFVFSKGQDWLCGPPSILFIAHLGCFQGAKGMGDEDNHSPPTGAGQEWVEPYLSSLAITWRYGQAKILLLHHLKAKYVHEKWGAPRFSNKRIPATSLQQSSTNIQQLGRKENVQQSTSSTKIQRWRHKFLTFRE